MAAFRNRFPDVCFEICEGNTLDLADQIRNGVIDLAIVRAPFRSEEFSCVFLEEEPMVAVGDESYFSKIPGVPACFVGFRGAAADLLPAMGMSASALPLKKKGSSPIFIV